MFAIILGIYVSGFLWSVLGWLVAGTTAFGFDWRRGFYRAAMPMDPGSERFLRTGRWD